MKIDNLKIEELKATAKERALSEAYSLATIGIEEEDLKLFEFENGKRDYIIADNLDNAIGFYIVMVGEQATMECEINEIKDWHDLILIQEDGNGASKEKTFLEIMRENHTNWYSNPFLLTSAYLK